MHTFGKTIKSVFNKIFPVISEIKKDKKSENPYAKILKWFEKNKLNINNDISDKEYSDLLVSVDGLQEFVKNHLPKIEEKEFLFFNDNSKLFMAFVESITPNDINRELKRPLVSQRKEFFKRSLRQNFINNYLNFIKQNTDINVNERLIESTLLNLRRTG